jgi:hypothetical protein
VYDPKALNRPKPKALAGARSTTPKTAAISGPVRSQDLIRERAYQLYERRGGQDGHALQDWLMAEKQILDQHR